MRQYASVMLEYCPMMHNTTSGGKKVVPWQARSCASSWCFTVLSYGIFCQLEGGVLLIVICDPPSVRH